MSIPSTHISLLCDLRKETRREETWAVFHTRYHQIILRWCVCRGLSPDGAEDLTQDVLVKLFQQLPRYHHDPARGQFRGWLKTVVNNILTDFWRRQERQPECNAIGGSEFLQHLACLANPESAGELSGLIDDRAQTTASEVLHRVRAKLKETTWQAFHQSMVDHLPAAEVAEKLNLSIASVYKATYRVKQMLIEEYRHAYSPSSLSDALSRSRDTQETPV